MLVRIKTEEEFIIQFGIDWRNKTHRPFLKSMDYLLNKRFDIPTELYEKLLTWKVGIIGKDIVSLDMIVFLPDRPKKKLNSKYILL